MKKQIISAAFYFQHLAHLPIIDVRSPGEFAKGHIAEAHNVELFTDEERAIVGTAYKRQSKEKAIEIGYEFVTPKLSEFVEKSIAIAPDKIVVIHCWRGGMRSNSFADHLVENGFEKVYVIEKGYKAFRSYVLQFFGEEFNLKMLGGYTGSGKTEILHALKHKSQQVIDLEGLAKHRGSAFGGIDLPPQPTTEQFENNLFEHLINLDGKLPIWVEDESISIGKVTIPHSFFDQMRLLPVYFLDIPFEERTKHLVDTYATLNQAQLAEAIVRITKRIGHDKAKIALDALHHKNYKKVVELALVYYDNSYQKGVQKRQESSILKLEVATIDAETTASLLINLMNEKNG